MLSRVAECIYWMARYIERAENMARIVSVNANLLMDLPKGVAPGWEPLIAITGNDELYRKSHDSYGERQVVRFLLGDLQNPGSILSALQQARESARTIRDIIPREGWEQVNELYMYASDNLNAGLTKRGRYGYLKGIVLRAQTIAGLLAGTTNYDEGYQFLLIGRNLERCDMTTRFVDVRSENLLPDEPTDELRTFDNIQWVSVLKSLTGYQMYRRSMQVRVSRRDVLRFLIQTIEFPRSVLHTIDAVEQSILKMPNNEAPLRIIGRIKRQIMGASLEKLRKADLHQFVDEIQVGIGTLHGEIAKTYFLPPPAPEAISE